ncbi:hypothetical protein QL093DRAFT_2460415 [Fusarium oxysporum]|nr:hypothetical protein QL093DRAFT_2460415 [Fusarium oxysporum]
MESNSPFEKLPAELITIILSTTNSPADIQSIIRADPYIWRVFLQHKHSILRPFIQDLVSQYTRPYLTHLAIACCLRAIERKFYAQSRDQVEKVIKPLSTSSQEPFSVTQFNLGPMSEVYRLHRETDVFVLHYSEEAWEVTQDMAAREAEKDLPRLPLSLPLSETEAQQIQETYLLLEAFRHSLCFRTSFLQHYDSGEPANSFHIPWRFYYQDKLLCIRDFQAVFVFLFKEHEKLLNRIHDRITGPACLSRIENNDTDWRIRRR